MLSVVSPEKVSKTCFTYALLTLPIGVCFAATGVTTWYFAIDSLIVNLCVVHQAWKFNSEQTNVRARKVFRASLIQLPLLLLLLLIHQSKKEDSTKEATSREKALTLP